MDITAYTISSFSFVIACATQTWTYSMNFLLLIGIQNVITNILIGTPAPITPNNAVWYFFIMLVFSTLGWLFSTYVLLLKPSISMDGDMTINILYIVFILAQLLSAWVFAKVSPSILTVSIFLAFGIDLLIFAVTYFLVAKEVEHKKASSGSSQDSSANQMLTPKKSTSSLPTGKGEVAKILLYWFLTKMVILAGQWMQSLSTWLGNGVDVWTQMFTAIPLLVLIIVLYGTIRMGFCNTMCSK